MIRKFIVFVVMIFISSTAFAAEGTIDWERGVIRATGIGSGKLSTRKPDIYRAQAKRSAIMDAQRNLAEIVEGVHIFSESELSNLEISGDFVHTIVNTLITSLSEVDSRYFNDGTCEVTLELNIFGEKNSLAALIVSSSIDDYEKFPFPQPIDEINLCDEHFTGLIVDCRGLNFNPVMLPSIEVVGGKIIYAYNNLSREKIVCGMVSYVKNISDAARAGDNPLIIKAVRLEYSNSVAIIDPFDADKILSANRRDKFLENCAVVFIR